MKLPSFLNRFQHGKRHSRAYLFGGRVRVSTAGLIVAFVALFWVYQNYEPPPAQLTIDPAQQVVPPGFVPDPDYTWVPRTNVQTREPDAATTTRTTTTTTTSPTPTTTPESPTDTSPTTTPSDPGTNPLLPGSPTTTVIDPDGPGPQSPETFTQAPPTLAPTTAVPPGTAPESPQPSP